MQGGGNDLFGVVTFDRGPTFPDALVPAIALRHSNAGRWAISLAFGAYLLVCSNGLLVGDIKIRQTHVQGIDLDGLVSSGFEEFSNVGSRARDFCERLMHTSIWRDDGARLLVEAARNKVVPWELLRAVDKAWNEPSHEDFQEPTAWSLYNAFTEAAKSRGPQGQMLTLERLVDFFSEDSLDSMLGQ